MNQSELIHQYNQENKSKFNDELFVRSDQDIIDELKNIILSCQRENQYFTIKVDGFTEINDYDEINNVLFNFYDNTMQKKPVDKRNMNNKYNYISIRDSEIRLLIVHYYIKVKDNENRFNVIIEVPRIIDRYYFKINGTMYSSMYQIVDGSTYNNSTSSNAKKPSIAMKIVFQATRVFRLINKLKTTDGEEVYCAYYKALIFKKSVSAVKYILARYGLNDGLSFLGVKYISILEEDPHIEYNYTFKKAEHIFISVPKILFNNDKVTQTVVYTLYLSLVNGIDFNEFFTTEYWVRSIGGDFNSLDEEKFRTMITKKNEIPDTIDKGYSILDSFASIYDIRTRESIRLPMEDKADMYCVIRWMIREFDYLKNKDNLDLTIKKFRWSHYIASLYAMKIVNGIYRVADQNKKLDLRTIEKALKTSPDFLLTAITSSTCALKNYRNAVTDLDALTALKYTYKGVSGLGESSSNSIPDRFRAIHPSHLGIVDLDCSSNTDPGVSGILCPFAKTYNGYFNEYNEPNYWQTEYNNTLRLYRQSINRLQAITFIGNVLNQDVSEIATTSSEVHSMIEEMVNVVNTNEAESEYVTINDDSDDELTDEDLED